MISKEELDRAFDSRFDPAIKAKLQCARVAVAGLGGLGSNIAVMLARSGVGHLFLVDFDRVDTTNLNRQAYSIPHLGMNKTDAIELILADINPYLDIKTQCVKVTPENVSSLFGGYNIVCEAFDKPGQKAMLVRELLTQTDATVVSGNGMAGYGDSNEIKTNEINSRLFVCGDLITDVGSGTGLMAPRVAVCAGHQANKVIQLILK
ncbi:MAG: sulfur carrier protein ThiS adenylyltransferase ThiF [Clostridia bacterium]|nr:sulfur carrier protein ThiS adenylyltransferase ThiF [Clostridia bacterium]